MMCVNVLTVAALATLGALANGSGYNPGYEGLNLHEPKVFDDHNDWLGNNNDGYSMSHSEKHFQVFVQIMNFVKNQQDVDTENFMNLYKSFVKSVWNLRRESKQWGYQKNNEKISQGKFYHQKQAENWNDICDEMDGSDREVKTKKLFMVYLQFRTHYLEQTKMEYNMGKGVEKTKKQFSLFLRLVSYTEKARYDNRGFREFSQYMEVKLKVQYSSFKKCVFHSHCEKWETVQVSGKKRVELEEHLPYYNIGGYHDRDNYQNVKAGDRFALFNKAQIYARMISDKHYYDNDHDAYIDWNYNDEDEYQKDKHPIIAFFIALHSHLSKYGPRDFWVSRGNDANEAHLKFLFFTVRAYKQIQVQTFLRERRAHPQERFARFSNFLDRQEDGTLARHDFGNFQTWYGVEKNQRKLAEFEFFLKNLAVVKRFPLGHGGKTLFGGHYSPFGLGDRVGFGGHFAPHGYGNGIGYGGQFGLSGFGIGNGYGSHFEPVGYGSGKGYGHFEPQEFNSLKGYGNKFPSIGYVRVKQYQINSYPVLYSGAIGFWGRFAPQGYDKLKRGYFSPVEVDGKFGYKGHFVPIGHGSGHRYEGYVSPLGYSRGVESEGQYAPLRYAYGVGYVIHFGPQGFSNNVGYGGGYAPLLALRKYNDGGKLYRDEEAMKEEYYSRMYNRLRFYEPQYKSSSYKEKQWW